MEEYKIISFKEGLNRTDYPKENLDKVKLFISENINKYKESASVYLTFCFNKNIFVIKHILDVIWKNKSYQIELLIYLPITFPSELRIYIHKIAKMEINKPYTEKNIIDFSTLEFYYQNIIVYTPLEDPITELIGNIYNQFCSIFPLYKAVEEREYVGPCYLNKEKTFLIDIKPEDIKIYESLQNNRKRMVEKILNLMNTKTFEIQKAASELDDIEKNIDQKLQNIYIRNKSKENVELEDIVYKLREIESNLKEQIQNLKYRQDNNILSIIHEIIKIKDEKKFEYTEIKKTIEDYLLYIKKGMEKKVINFEDCINKIRRASKELFYIMYCIEQRNKKNQNI